MEKKQEVKEALRVVTDAASIHADRLEDTLKDGFGSYNDSFRTARAAYIKKLNAAVNVIAAVKLDEQLKLKERVSDLTLEESLDLLEAVQDHIRNRPRTTFSEFK